MSRSRILFMVSGSIAAYKACEIISRLIQKGLEVRVASSKGGLKFVGEATLEGLSGQSVFKDVFESGRAMDHIHLAKWADVAVLCPASANRINQMASGTGYDVLSTLFLAYNLAEKPYLVFPAMNHQMLLHPATQASLKKLESWKIKVFPTAIGHQACGDTGEGRMLEPAEIFEKILEEVKR